MHGLIEWIDHTETLRSIATRLYKRMSLEIDMHKVRAIMSSDKMQGYLKLCQQYPTILYEFFHSNFLHATEWINGRRAFSQTMAQMSILGYIVGLGDRHAENILLRTSDGTCFHVDFSCLFDKAKGFEVPELVPFRLTRNLVRVLGRSEVSQEFLDFGRQAVEVSKKHELDLLGLLDSLFYDPLVEWSKMPSMKNADGISIGFHRFRASFQ